MARKTKRTVPSPYPTAIWLETGEATMQVTSRDGFPDSVGGGDKDRTWMAVKENGNGRGGE